MRLGRSIRLGSLASTVKGFAHGQAVFVVLASRKASAPVLALAIGRDPMDRLARGFRSGVGVGIIARFPTANVRMASVTGEGEITLFENDPTWRSE